MDESSDLANTELANKDLELFLMLAKDEVRSGNDGCPAVYIEERDGEFVIQGPEVSAEELTHLKNVLPGETALRISIEVVREALAKYDAGVRVG